MKPKKIKLQHGERIISVVPEFCSGPGWSNAPIWVHIATLDGHLRTECIQPKERNEKLQALFAVGEVVCRSLVSGVSS